MCKRSMFIFNHILCLCACISLEKKARSSYALKQEHSDLYARIQCIVLQRERRDKSNQSYTGDHPTNITLALAIMSVRVGATDNVFFLEVKLLYDPGCPFVGRPVGLSVMIF